jgi:hypothetical protein
MGMVIFLLGFGLNSSSLLSRFFLFTGPCFAVFILDGIRLELEIQPFQINWF